MKYYFCFFFFSLLICACEISNFEKQTSSYDLNQKGISVIIPDSILQNGDIILKKGYGVVSELVTKTLDDGNPFSHAGIVYKKNDTTFIIHSISKEFSNIDGVQKTLLDTFLLDCKPHTIRIIRWKNMIALRERLANIALHYSSKNIPFDYQFDYKNPNKMYCNELLYHCLINVNDSDFFVKKVVNKTELLTFSCFLDTNLFTFVSNY